MSFRHPNASIEIKRFDHSVPLVKSWTMPNRLKLYSFGKFLDRV